MVRMLNRQIPNLQSHLHHQSAYLRRIDNPFERCPFAFFGHLALFVVGIDRSMEYWIQRTTRVRFSRSVIQDFNCCGVEPSAGGLTNATMDALDDWFQDEFVQSANYYHPRVLYFTSVRRSYFWTKLALPAQACLVQVHVPYPSRCILLCTVPVGHWAYCTVGPRTGPIARCGLSNHRSRLTASVPSLESL